MRMLGAHPNNASLGNLKPSDLPVYIGNPNSEAVTDWPADSGVLVESGRARRGNSLTSLVFLGGREGAVRETAGKFS